MSPKDDLISQLSAAQDAAADLALLRAALGVESVTSNETPFARFLGEQMDKLGFAVGAGAFLDGRENVWGVKSGAAAADNSAQNLMFVGHTDTVHTRGWQRHWGEDARSDPFGAAEVDGAIWGRGACDLKGGICAALGGLRLLAKVGLQPAGGVTCAFIGDEESGEPGSGVSAGAKDLVRRVKAGEIARPDFAVYVEPTKLDVYTAQIGFFIADITVTGKSAYFGKPELGLDALKAAHTLLSALWAHERELHSGPSHDLVGTSSILVTSMESGGYIAVPGESRLSLIRKLRPGEDLDAAVAAFESALAAAELADGVTVNIDYPAGRDHPKGGSPVEIPGSTPSALLLQECVQSARPAAGAIAGAPYWSEVPFWVNEIGCPAVYCAPGDIGVAHTFEERINIDEYLAAVRAFALFVARFCGQQPSSQTPA